MTGRCETETVKIDTEGAPSVFLHIERWKHSAPTFWVSSPPKFKDSAVGLLLEKIMDQVNEALR